MAVVALEVLGVWALTEGLRRSHKSHESLRSGEIQVRKTTRCSSNCYPRDQISVRFDLRRSLEVPVDIRTVTETRAARIAILYNEDLSLELEASKS